VINVAVTNDPLSESICSGKSTNIHLTADVPGATFSWTASGSSAAVSGYTSGSGNFIDQTLVNSDSIDQFVTYYITPILGNCIGNTVAYVVTVIPNVPLSVTITASSSAVCPGIPVTFTAIPVNGGNFPFYQWKVNGNNAGMNSPNFSYTPFNNDSICCILNSGMSCTSGNPATSNYIQISIYPVNQIHLGNDTSICPGNSITFNAGICPGCTYLWSDLTTGQFNIGSGQTYTTGNPGIYSVAVTDVNGCISKDTIQLSYQFIAPVIYGNNAPCNDTTIYTYQTEPGMVNYQWIVSSGGTIVSGSTTNQVMVKWNDPGSQVVVVTYFTPNGCTAQDPTQYNVFVHPLPAQAGPIRGPQQLCSGYPDQTYSVDTILYAQSYEWQVTPGFQITTGQGTNVITLSIDTNSISADIRVYGVNSCGNGLLSPPFSFTVVQSPMVDAGQDQSVFYDSTTVLSGSVSGGSGSYSYSWEPSGLLIGDTLLHPRTLKLMHDTVFKLKVTDLVSLCQSIDSVRIKVVHQEITEGCLVFHNVITPNGDGLNDRWIIDCIENFPDNNVSIYNIWGDEIYHFNQYDNITNVWKGTKKNGKKLPDGTYYYVVTIKNGGKYCGWIFVRG